MRLPSLYMQAISLRYSTVLTNRAGGQSTYKLWLITSLQERAAFPVNHEILLGFINEISLKLIIQGATTPFTQNNELSRMNNLLQQIYSAGMPSTGIAHILCGEAKYWLAIALLLRDGSSLLPTN
ncbi:MAG: hypothetical protein CVV06_20395 [Gammaproteobacteria bacterium HGW-Gammaproteobacteria-10]|nr:MAG: hypothetical protein CVV06_20395 [Gammaproteobacteria bacterium HGW-Gammaproteobacteria-10]